MTPEVAMLEIEWAGVRVERLDGISTILIWSDDDRPLLRQALRAVGMDDMPVRYLDGDGIPARMAARKRLA